MEKQTATAKERGKVMEREATTPKKNVYIVPDDGDRLMQPNEVCARLGTDNKFLKKLIILNLFEADLFWQICQSCQNGAEPLHRSTQGR